MDTIVYDPGSIHMRTTPSAEQNAAEMQRERHSLLLSVLSIAHNPGLDPAAVVERARCYLGFITSAPFQADQQSHE